MRREEAIIIVQELLETCRKMDEIYLCMIPPKGSSPIVTLGYQIHIKKTPFVDEETERCIELITKKHQLLVQEFKAEDKMIIYRKH